MAKRTLYTKSRGRAVSRDARKVREGLYHIITGIDNRWRVVADGNMRPSRVFSDRQKAIDYARTKARYRRGKVVVHTAAGLVGRVISAA